MIYKIECIDTGEMYIGQTISLEDRIHSHGEATHVSDSKLYTCIRDRGGLSRWDIQPLGTYMYNPDWAHRLEWYWWKVTGATLNTMIPGQRFIKNDLEKLNHKTEDELVVTYEILERCCNIFYRCTEMIPQLWIEKIVYIDDEPPPPNDDPICHIFEIVSSDCCDKYVGFAIGDHKWRPTQRARQFMLSHGSNWVTNHIKTGTGELLDEYGSMLSDYTLTNMSKEFYKLKMPHMY